ncbi:hypothetical protein SARC_03004 [Sphaeroforma arctica JP610]|uniref:Mediator complex subunit 15 KIX domain-containing protein n=1 Tax=Sphaeroforma arctica JP610 TaxID=667725 RepID=A0A0L0G7D3_9EUKA|nr:hypothetical protein SARC_03004 [Sphaeroforma arctica JP610]KNC84796.1 hypothetical protein SARC_03004 [Sphaeroforma arctica JP610]|eukprot:XP_014158698.1 hypothetical protein SARC_03004 [Sphaeroforma arctica JP610]
MMAAATPTNVSATWKQELSDSERQQAVQTLQDVIKRMVPSEGDVDETKTEHTLGLSWEDAIYNQAESKDHYNQLITETVANGQVLLAQGIKEENQASAQTSKPSDPDTVLETKEGTLGEVAMPAPPAPKKMYMRLEIAEGQTFTREQSIEILKQLKFRNMLSVELCAQLHTDLTDLDGKREEMDVKEYETKMTSIVQNALKASSTH